MPFLGDTLHLISLNDPRRFVVSKPLVYIGRSEEFTVPFGFSTDLASVPDSLTWLAPRYGIYTRAAVLHDWLCQQARRGHINQADADGIFRRVLRELGVSLPRRWLMWTAVRVGSRLDGATVQDVGKVLLIGTLAVPFLALPTVPVWLFQQAFRILEGRE